MTIEPISSLMTVQAQGSAVQKTQSSTQIENPENLTGGVQPAEKIDKTTAVVESSKEKGQSGSEEQRAKEQQTTNENIRKAVEQMNKNMGNSEAVFGIHEGTNRVMIKIVDKTTKEVIRELPPEKTLDMIARVWDMAGILVDEKR